MSYTSEDLARFRSYERVHLRGIDENLSPGGKVEALRGRDRNKKGMLLFNVLAILFFTWSHFFSITTLSNTVYYILLVVFSLNVSLILLQRKQIRELAGFYESGGSGSAG